MADFVLGLAAAGLGLFCLALIHAAYLDARRWLDRGRTKQPAARAVEWVDFYGDHHRAERAKYADIIRLHGGICMERDCILPSRRINPGAYWHLAHDHLAGGPYDYLGPAHPECNEHEARSRGVTWDDEAVVADDNHLSAPTDDESIIPTDDWSSDGDYTEPPWYSEINDPWADTLPSAIAEPEQDTRSQKRTSLFSDDPFA